MPVSREMERRYPRGSLRCPEWRAIRASILARAGQRCEGIPAYPDCRAADGAPHPVTGSRVVLTIAHMDHDPGNSDAANLRALCQRRHNTYDAAHRRVNAAATRHRRRAIRDLFAKENAS